MLQGELSPLAAGAEIFYAEQLRRAERFFSLEEAGNAVMRSLIDHISVHSSGVVRIYIRSLRDDSKGEFTAVCRQM